MHIFTIPKSVTLSAVSTDQGAQPFTFGQFLTEFVLVASSLRSDPTGIEMIFELEELFADKKAGDVVELGDDLWSRTRDAAKQEIDSRMASRQLVPAFLPKILRHYHAFATAKKLTKSEATS